MSECFNCQIYQKKILQMIDIRINPPVVMMPGTEAYKINEELRGENTKLRAELQGCDQCMGKVESIDLVTGTKIFICENCRDLAE